MASLAEKRPIFHSEADFQHALAWELHEIIPGCEIRLEYNPVPDRGQRMALDLWVRTEEVAIELKYAKKSLSIVHKGERFMLRQRGAQPPTRYDYIKDIQRVEREVKDGRAKHGFAILLTNEQGYWNPPGEDELIDSAFRIHDGEKVTGELAWSDNASEGTKKGKEAPLVINGIYRLQWHDYKDLHQKNSYFRYLAVHVRDL